jgi:hypothetical protein
MTDETNIAPEPEAPPVASVVEPPAAPTPYRSLPVEPAPFVMTHAPTRLVTLWAPAFMVSGVLLWSFVVMGQLVTTYAPGRHDLLVGEVTGIFFVLAASSGAWVSALRQSLRVSPTTSVVKRMERGIALGTLALLAWGASLIVAMIVGKALPDGLVTLLLIAAAGGAFGYGRHLLHDPFKSKERSLLAISLWAGAGLLTLAALIALSGD